MYVRRACVLAGCALGVMVSGAASQDGSVRVIVDGLRPVERRNVLATLSIASATGGRNLSDARVARLHQRAPGEIALALEPFGYYRAGVESELRREGQRWSARYRVDPGPRVSIRSVSIDITGPGADEPRIQQSQTAFPLVPGSPLSHTDYELGKTRFLQAAAELGYLDAGFDVRELRIDRGAQTADIQLHFVTGPRYRFGSTSFPNNALDSTLARQFIPYRPGDPFNGGLLLTLQVALSGSPYFDRAEVIPRRDLATDLAVPIEIHLSPRPFQTYEVGAGYGTNSGPRVGLDVEFPRLNRSGLRAEGGVAIAQRERRISGRLIVPPTSPQGLVLTTQGAYTRKTVSTSSSETGLASVSLSRSRGAWQASIGTTFQHEAFSIGADTGLSTLLVPTVAVSHTRADDRIVPTTAERIRFELQAALHGLASDASFVRTGLRLILIRSAGRARLLLRGEAGAVFTNTFRDLPPSIRYFTGGDNSVRGYEYRSLGPRDVHDQPVGGRYLATVSTEVEYRVWRDWGVAAFTDAGNALSDLPIVVEQGLGAGIRWRSPVGLVRLDGAFAVTRNGWPFRIHLMVGPDL